MPKNNNNNKQDLAILAIQKDLEFIKLELVEIKTNHLHGLCEELKGLKVELENLKEQLNKRPTWAITILVSFTVAMFSFILANYLK